MEENEFAGLMPGTENEADMENAGPGQEAAETEPAETVNAKSPEEAAFLNALHQRKVIAESLKAGTLACLPGPDGLADTEPAVNLASGTRYHGSNQLYLKDFQKKNGFPTAEFVTSALAEKSGIPIRKGQHGVWIDFKTQNGQTGQWEQKNVRLFNIAQAVNPAKLKTFAENTAREKQQEKEEYLRQMYGSAYQPKKTQEKKPGPEFVCNSADPEKYLGQYLAAVSTGGTFSATREQAAAFSRNMGASLFERSANGHTNPFKLSKICNAAGEHCRNAIKEAYAPKTGRKQEFRRGRSM
jgi:hypothetical protein